jgi:tetratricopeptide (TPR) repeat protein
MRRLRFGANAVTCPVPGLQRRRAVAVGLLCLLALVLSPWLASVASAQSARELYDRGMQALSAGHYADAVQALDASYRKEAKPVALYNLGLAYKGLGHTDRALEAFESYVKYADPKKEGKTIDAVRAEIGRIKSAYARFALKLTPPEATLEIDGAPASASHGELWVQVGKHKVTVHADGYDSYEQALEVAAGHFDLDIHLHEASGPPEMRAAALVDEGIALQAAADMQPAIAKYKAAEAIYPTPRAEAQMGLAEESIGDLASAEEHLDQALQHPKDAFIRENKRKLKAARDRIKPQLATLTVKGAPEGAEILVNGKSMGLLPLAAPLRVLAGSITLTAKKQGYSEFEQIFDLPRRGQRTIRVQMDQAPPALAAVPLAAPVAATAPPIAGAVPALTEQSIAPLPEESPKTEAPAQADIEAAAEPQAEPPPTPTGPPPEATGFEMALNFGYQPWIGGPKTDGSSGMFSPQVVLGARLLWPLSFGLQLNGGFDFAAKGTSFVATVNPGVYVRGHIQRYRKRLSFDAWGGLGLQPLAMQIAALKADTTVNTNADPNTIDPSSAEAKALRQNAGVDRVHTVQSINVPFELGGTFFVTEGFGFDLGVGLTLWLPQQSCLHNGSDHLCTNSGLKSQTSLFLGGGVSFLP